MLDNTDARHPVTTRSDGVVFSHKTRVETLGLFRFDPPGRQYHTVLTQHQGGGQSAAAVKALDNVQAFVLDDNT